MHSYNFGFWWMWVFGALAVVGLVVLIFVVVRIFGGGIKPAQPPGDDAADGSSQPATSPRRILDERYAQGELTTEEYQERLTTLNEGS